MVNSSIRSRISPIGCLRIGDLARGRKQIASSMAQPPIAPSSLPKDRVEIDQGALGPSHPLDPLSPEEARSHGFPIREALTLTPKLDLSSLASCSRPCRSAARGSRDTSAQVQPQRFHSAPEAGCLGSSGHSPRPWQTVTEELGFELPPEASRN